jgi:hypothetical protein
MKRQNREGAFLNHIEERGTKHMNAYEQLVAIRDRLEQLGAHEDSIAMVSRLIKRTEPERDSQTNVPQSMLLRHMLRQREVLDNYSIYDDLQELMSENEERRGEERSELEEEEHHPRPHSYYRQQKMKEREKESK